MSRKRSFTLFSYVTGTGTNLTYLLTLVSLIWRSNFLLLPSGNDSSTKTATLGSVPEMNVAHSGQFGAAFADDILLHEMRET